MEDGIWDEFPLNSHLQFIKDACNQKFQLVRVTIQQPNLVISVTDRKIKHLCSYFYIGFECYCFLSGVFWGFFLPVFAYIGFCTWDWNLLQVVLVGLDYIIVMMSEDQVSCIPGWFRRTPHSDLRVPVIKIIVKRETRNRILSPFFLDSTTKWVLQGVSRDPTANAHHKSNMANGTIDIPFNTGPEHLSIADSE